MPDRPLLPRLDEQDPEDLLPAERLPEERVLVDLEGAADRVGVDRTGVDRVRVAGDALRVDVPVERTFLVADYPLDRTLRDPLVPLDLTFRVALLPDVVRTFRVALVADDRMLLPVVLVVERILVDRPDVTFVVVPGDHLEVVRSADVFNPDVGRVELPPITVRPVELPVDPE